MPTTERERLKQARAKASQQEKNIRTFALVVVAVIVIAVVWGFLSSRAPAAGSVGAPAVTLKQYDAPPPMTIDPSRQYFATVKIFNGGEFVIQLFPDKAPITVNNFVFLAREGYFTGVTFHRVLEGFMAQTGDQTGTGSGGPGYEFQDEISDLAFDKAGVVAMANPGRPDTNGSQFFITFAPTEWLNGLHTIFGQVVEGMDVVNGLTLRDPSQAGAPADVIESITITEE